MKLSKKTLLIITAGVLLIALAGVAVVYSQQVDEQTLLKEQLASAQSKLEQERMRVEGLSSRQTQLEKQLIQATSQFEAAKADLAQQPVSSIAAATVLFDIAQANGVEVTEMTSSAPAIESLEEVTFSVIALTAKVKGDTSDLINFLLELNSSLVTGVIQSVTIQGDDAAEIKVVVYTYRGD